jgi:protein-S-isoprenylcysteine O-methyltransferase Ste14
MITELPTKVFNARGLRKALTRYQRLLGLAAAVAVLLLGRLDLYAYAVCVSFLGELIQVWSSASIEKNEVLSVRGPYVLVRNPMYLGRFLVILGVLLLLKNPYLIAAYCVLFVLYMVNRVRREERKLEKVFGDPYCDYVAKVRAFVPRLTPYERGKLGFFSWRLLTKNNEHLNFLALAAFYLIFYFYHAHWRT